MWILFRIHKHGLSSHTLGMCPVCNAIHSLASYNTNTFQIILFYLSPFPPLLLSSSLLFCSLLLVSLHIFSTECTEFVSTPIFYGTKFKTIPHTRNPVWGRVMENILYVKKVFRCALCATCLEINCACGVMRVCVLVIRFDSISMGCHFD